jgi:hypothetical protein
MAQLRRFGQVIEVLLVGCCGACSHPLKSGSDAAAAGSDAAESAEVGTAADLAPFSGPPDGFEVLFDSPPNDPSPLPDSRDLSSDLVESAMRPQDALRSDATDAATREASLWADAQWFIDGACSDNPRDLMEILGDSLSTYEVFCSRTEDSSRLGIDPEGHIVFDSEGRVRSITGRRIPSDPNGWVESLATYRWPCLAGQTIAYGCSV